MDKYSGEKFLNKLYSNLHMSDEVMHTASNSDSKEEKVRKYLDRLEKVENLALSNKYNGLELLKKLYYKKYIIKEEDIPESYFKLQQEIALENGYGHIEIDNKTRKQMSRTIIDDQKKSLDIWLDYLVDKDSIYPEWFKYYAFQGMVRLGSYDKTKESYSKRTPKTASIFIELNREALSMVYDNIERVLGNEKINDDDLSALIENGSFGKIYAYFIRKVEENNKDISSNDGIWIKYEQGSDSRKLCDSLQGRGTGWCTAGYETAKVQLESGDFYVYYTKDSNGEYKQPRIAIRMDGKNKIGEIRGIAEHQNLESEMEEPLKEKLVDFPDKDVYYKKVKDMEKLTKIYKEYKNRDLTFEELKFLYEIDEKILSFGWGKDPRIEEILTTRNIKNDLSQIFNCSKDDISISREDFLDGKNIKYFYGDTYLEENELEENKNLKLPENVLGNFYLNVVNGKGLILPKVIYGSLSFEDPELDVNGLVLPQTIKGSLRIVYRDEDNVDGLIVPEGFSVANVVSSDEIRDYIESRINQDKIIK